MFYGTAYPAPYAQGGFPAQVPQAFPAQVPQAAPWTVAQPFVEGFVPVGAEPDWEWEYEDDNPGIVGIAPFGRRRRRRRRRLAHAFGKPFGKPFGKFHKPYGKGGYGKYGGYYY